MTICRSQCAVKAYLVYYKILAIITGALQIIGGILIILGAFQYSDDVLMQALEIDSM